MICGVLILSLMLLALKATVQSFKISYYEQKLENAKIPDSLVGMSTLRVLITMLRA